MSAKLVIWKFPLEVAEEQIIKAPESCRWLTLQVQFGTPCLWVLCDPNAPLEDFRITMLGTDHTVDSWTMGASTYIGTAQLDGFVWHYFHQL